jgi:arginyl-tRNA--protein-N-Asp/Glu arginylyltransferase
MNYLHWDEKTIDDFSDGSIALMYGRGFVFTRISHGAMRQTRSVRVDVSKFELSSENRRILKKTEGLEINAVTLPLREEYDWSIGKLAKDFYDAKFGPDIMSANKIKELLTDRAKSNFNALFTYSKQDLVIGYAICYTAPSFLHYSYPFYDLKAAPKDMGLGMMVRTVEYAKSAGMKYVYLGSLQRPTDTYKLQFSGLEWFDGKSWQTDIQPLKTILNGKPAR